MRRLIWFVRWYDV